MTAPTPTAMRSTSTPMRSGATRADPPTPQQHFDEPHSHDQHWACAQPQSQSQSLDAADGGGGGAAGPAGGGPTRSARPPDTPGVVGAPYDTSAMADRKSATDSIWCAVSSERNV